MKILNSPLSENDFQIIREYFDLTEIISAESIEEFKKNNTQFSDLLVNLTEKEKTRAWFYLKQLVKNRRNSKILNSSSHGNSKITMLKSLSFKQKLGIVNLFIIVIVLFFVGYKLITNNSDENKFNKDEAEKEFNRSYVAQESVKKMLKDPDSAKFRNMNGFCGELNSKNSFGAYTGYVRFIGTPELTLIEGQNSQINEETFSQVWIKFCK